MFIVHHIHNAYAIEIVAYYFVYRTAYSNSPHIKKGVF